MRKYKRHRVFLGAQSFAQQSEDISRILITLQATLTTLSHEFRQIWKLRTSRVIFETPQLNTCRAILSV